MTAVNELQRRKYIYKWSLDLFSLSLSLFVLPFLVSFSLLPELCYVSDLPVYVTKEIYKETHREEEGERDKREREREREHNHTADT